MINGHGRLEQDEVNELFHKLYPYTQVSEEAKKKHIADINRENMELPFL